MEVTFYKTKLTRQNRCYGATEYDNYLNSCTKKVIILSHDIVPNNPFYLETDEGMWGYNYITYTYKGYLFGAFIDGIRIQALSGSTQIIHATDNWYFALKNVGIDNMDFHGQCMRAHVNDVVQKGSNHYATLQYTTAAPEEYFNEANCVSFLDEPTFKWTTDPDMYWLYIYIANPREAGIVVGESQAIRYPYGNRKYVSNMGITLTYPLTFKNSLSGTDSYTAEIHYWNGSVAQTVDVDSLTDTFITSMLITRIPPRNDIVGMEMIDTTGGFPDSYLAKLHYNHADNVPYYFNWLDGWTPFEFKFADEPVTFVLFADDNLAHLTSAEDFRRNGCYKLYSSIYNPIRIGNNFLNTLKCNKEDIFYVSLTFDLSQTIIFNPSANNLGLQGITILNNSLVFAPNAVNDYWTRLNALQTSLAGQVLENKGAIQGIGNIFGLISDVVDVGSSLAIDSVGTLAGSAPGLAEHATTFERRQENARLTEQSGQITQEIASRQYRAGTTTNKAISLYGLPSCDESAIISVFYTLPNLDVISKNLHRYGYNTFLQLDDIYFNHKRENFNYIKAADCEVVGVPTDIATDLENMFLNGVHLWSGEVENFDVVNYQEGLTW